MNKKKSKTLKITTEHLALRDLRLSRKLTLAEASLPLGIKSKALGHIENGRVKLTKDRIDKIVLSLGYHYHDFLRAKKRVTDDIKNKVSRKTIKTVLKNSDRRSYQKIITKEVLAIRSLRILRKLSQDQASYLCGFSRPTFGHIENGRITLNQDKIELIVKAFGFKMETFDRYLKDEVMRYEIVEHCKNKILDLSDDKLNLIKGIIDSMS